MIEQLGNSFVISERKVVGLRFHQWEMNERRCYLSLALGKIENTGENV